MAKSFVPYFFRGEKGKKRLKLIIGIAAAVLLAVIFILLTVPKERIYDAPEVKTLESRGVLRVGIRADMPGFSQGETGFEVELANRLAEFVLKNSEVSSVKLVEVTAQSAVTKLDDGTIDVAISMMQKDEYAKYAYSDAYYEDEISFFADRVSVSSSIDEMLVGYIQSSACEDAFNSLNKIREDNGEPKIEGRAFASYPDMLFALKRDRVQAVLLKGAYYKRYGEEYGLIKLGEPIGTVSYAAAVSTDSPAIAQLASIMFAEMRESGEMDRLKRLYGIGE